MKDDNGCLMYDTSSVTEPTPIVITKLPTHLKCNNDGAGAIDLSVVRWNTNIHILVEYN